MKIAKIPLLITIIVLGSILSPVFIHSTHAATGQICLADPTTASLSTPCPSSPPVFSGPAGEQIRIGVYISGSDPMSGFDITLLTNQSLLVPSYFSSNAVDLTGSVVNTATTGPAVVVTLCIDGQLIAGTTCVDTDRTHTIHLAVASALGGPLTPNPTTGLLFTALFNITGRSSGGQPIGFQSAVNDNNGNPLPTCRSETSVPNYCVTIANGTPTPDAETLQTATFNNASSSTMPSLIFSANATSFGPEFPGVINHVNITATDLNGYSVNSTNPVRFTMIATRGLSVSPSTGSCTSEPCSLMLALNPSAAGDYSLTVTGDYHSFDSSGNPDTLEGTINLIIIVYDFGFTISTTAVTFISGEIGTTTATVFSLNGFSGVVVLSTRIVVPNGISITYSPNTINLDSGESTNSTITFHASPSLATTYHVQINLAYAGRVKSSPTITVTVIAPVPDFYLVATPKTIGPVSGGLNGTSIITVTYVNGFNSTVSLSISPSPNIFASLNQTSLTETHNITLTASSQTGTDQAIIVTSSGGGITHSIAVTLVVIAGSFTIYAHPPSITTVPQVTGRTLIGVSPAGGFVGEVSLNVDVGQSTPFDCVLSPTMLSGGGGFSTLACTSSSVGNFTVIVTGTSGSTTESVTVTLNVTNSVDFSLYSLPLGVETSPGVIGTSQIVMDSRGGFSGTVTLSSLAPQGLSCSLSPASIVGSGESILSCLGTTGKYIVTVAGTSGQLTHSVKVGFNIQPPKTGVVCIASDGSTSCPSTSPGVISTNSSPPSQVRVAVVVNSSTPLAGFDITLFADHTILKPVGIDLTGSVLIGTPIILQECLGGHLVTGRACLPADTIDTTHLSAASAIGSVLTEFPITGLLFTAIYNLTGTTSGTIIRFQEGCSNTSIAGGTCVTIMNGSPLPDAESIEPTVFANSPTFVLQTTASINPIVIATGTSALLSLNLTSVNGFAGRVTLTSGASPSTLTVTISHSFVELNSTTPIVLTSASVVVESSTLPGNYTVKITGSNGTLSSSFIFLITVVSSDFTIALSSTSLALETGQSSVTTVIVGSLQGFAGTITFTTTVSQSGLALSSLPTLSLQPSGINSSNLMVVSNNSTRGGTFTVTVTATNGTISHVVILTVNIEDFQVTIDPRSVTLNPGASGEFRVQVQSINNFHDSLSLTASQSQSVTAELGFLGSGSFQPTLSIEIVEGQDLQLLLETTASKTALPGNYTVTLTARGFFAIHATTITVVVNAALPDFSVVTIPTTLTIRAGAQANSTVTIQSVGGFRGNLTLSYQANLTLGITVTIGPSSVTLSANTSGTAVLLVSTSEKTPVTIFTVKIVATNQTLSHTAYVDVQVIPPPPIAKFTFTPSIPIVGQNVEFNGNQSSSSTGFIILWNWNFGDSSGQYTSTFLIYHMFFNPGNYTVTLVVQDNRGFTASNSEVVNVIPRPAHDVAIVGIVPSRTVAVSTEIVSFQVELSNEGTHDEIIDLSVNANGHPVQTLNGIHLEACNTQPGPCFILDYAFVQWETTGVVPGNYTISATVFLPTGETDPTPQDNSFTDGTVTILRPPIITASPYSGAIGTQVTIKGSGFQAPYPSNFGFQFESIEITFDDMNIGSVLGTNGTFTFVLDIPLAQPGPHAIKALDEYTGAHTSTTFLVKPDPGSVGVTLDTGAVYFPGDTVTIYILTTLNGTRTTVSSLQLTLVYPNGTMTSIVTKAVSSGLYTASYKISPTGPLGTYSVLATAHEPFAGDGSALTVFEVKLSWLSSHTSTITSAMAAVAVLGFGGVAWHKGYLRRRKDDEFDEGIGRQ